MTICKGCGAVLQSKDPKVPGYTPKEEGDYCQRCFRLMHYDDLTMSMKTGIDPDEVLDRISGMDALILWVVDLFDFEAGMIQGISRKIGNKDIILICTKRDVLPDTLNQEKIARFVFGRLKEFGIKVKGLILTSKLSTDGAEQVKDAVNMFGQGRPVVVMGRANSGKSTLLNKMMGKEILTASRYPGTTLDFNELTIDDVKYIDTPGIEIQNSMLMNVDEKDLKTILPSRTIKPMIYQLTGDQSFAVGGLARVDIIGCDHATCTWYLSDRIKLHRSKVKGADELWKKHYGEMLVPIPLKDEFVTSSIHKNYEKVDVVIEGLGWACISGQVSTITVKAPKGVNVTFRKAMI